MIQLIQKVRGKLSVKLYKMTECFSKVLLKQSFYEIFANMRCIHIILIGRGRYLMVGLQYSFSDMKQVIGFLWLCMYYCFHHQ
jgi:hypothetical protein